MFYKQVPLVMGYVQDNFYLGKSKTVDKRINI